LVVENQEPAHSRFAIIAQQGRKISDFAALFVFVPVSRFISADSPNPKNSIFARNKTH